MSEYFAQEFLLEQFGDEIDCLAAARAHATLARQRRAVAQRLGPVCGPRQVYDLVTAPLAAVLGYRPSNVEGATPGGLLVTATDIGSADGPLLVTTAWGDRVESIARDAARAALSSSAAWCLCVNGQRVSLLDARRLYARRFLHFDLDTTLDHDATFAVLWALLSAQSFAGRRRGGGIEEALPLLERAIRASDQNTLGVCRSLREGVLLALAELLAGFLRARRPGRAPSPAELADVHQQALTTIYRVLFLLFAESRRLVPTWHSIYRENYSLDAARRLAERAGPATGLWETLQAISRLSHAGCHAADLRVTPFNGRLFSPAATPLAEHTALDDESARRMVVALSTTPRPGGRARIVYRDLDVEQLGAVYESVLDYAPRAEPLPTVGNARWSGRVTLAEGSGLRKSTASFYTPRSLTTYLVRRTLAPLVADASPEHVLAVRVVDPAMGSGAFLVAACRYLAVAYESALVREGRCLASDIDENDRRAFRRAVAQRCLYGVDLNPMAVQLARLSLWLATLAPDRPLTFLDHRLLVGDSLVGASMDDVVRRPAARERRRCSPLSARDLLLFDHDTMGLALRSVLPVRASVAERPDDTVGDVHEKERLIASLAGSHSPLARWKTVLDLWCAQSFVQAGRVAASGLFAAITDHVLTGRSSLAPRVAERCIAELASAIDHVTPFHWTLEFPEVFYAPDGVPLSRPGFDAVVGNPPWDMIRADNGPAADRLPGRNAASALLRFARESGIYQAQGDGHANRFQLFVERALQLVRTGGRIGLVLPWGVAADQGCAPLRRLLFDRATVDSLVGFDNAARIFPIHRSMRFVALSASSGGRTTQVPARLGERDPAVLDRMPSQGGSPADFPIVLSRGLLDRLSGESLAIPDLRRAEDIGLLEKLSRSAPALSSVAGWRAEFGRELNATDDRKHFVQSAVGLPVLEGKHIDSFRASATPVARRIPADVARHLLAAGRGFERPRLAYRDVSSATNRLTLIAAIVPAGCVTVHSLFCLRTPLPRRAQLFLCGILNSFVANFIVRFWVGSHVTTGIIGRLPAPRPDLRSPLFREIAGLAAVLSRAPTPLSHPAYPRLQASVARLYGLTEEELERVVGTFPLIDEEVKKRTHEEFHIQTR